MHLLLVLKLAAEQVKSKKTAYSKVLEAAIATSNDYILDAFALIQMLEHLPQRMRARQLWFVLAPLSQFCTREAF